MANMEEALICVFPNGGKYLLNVLVLSLTAGHVHKGWVSGCGEKHFEFHLSKRLMLIAMTYTVNLHRCAHM